VSTTRHRPSEASTVVWDRPQPVARSTPSPLSRELIVEAAIGLADSEGLEAVSLRRVGAALTAGPMRLYGYVSTKEELLSVMVDAVYGELVALGPLPVTWREALQALAHRTRSATLRHPWFADIMANRPTLGPNAMAHLEACLSVLDASPQFKHIDAVMQAVKTVNAYVLGAVRSEISERRMDLARWHAASGPYIEKLVATGRFPMFAKVMREAHHPAAEVVFEAGLSCVLDGLAARLQ
jgi:AcrR family transcriptional regulator